MQRPLKRALAGAAALALALVSTAQAQVGLTSNAATVTLNATKASTLTVTPSTGTATLASITDNSTPTCSPRQPTTDWNLTAGTSVRLIGWFATPAQALVNGSAVIPSSKVEGGINSGGCTPFTGAAVGGVGVAGGSLQLFSQAVAANFFSTRTDQLDLRLNLTGFRRPAPVTTPVRSTSRPSSSSLECALETGRRVRLCLGLLAPSAALALGAGEAGGAGRHRFASSDHHARGDGVSS